MDNVTHTLAGLAVAEAALAVRRRRGPVPEGLARAAWLASALGNNAPDIDIAYTGITEAPLGFLLHHRGHTHTILLAPIVALAPFLVARLFQKRWGRPPTRSSDAFLYGLAVLGCLLHVLMDYGNSYGVHPFWPLDSSWHYADSIFIVEPAWWLTLAIPIGLSTRAKVGRGILLSIGAAGVLLPIVTQMVSPLAVSALALVALGIYLGSRNLATDGARAALSIAASLAVALAFAAGHALAEPRARAALDGAFPDANEIDVVMLPEPGNPLCWYVVAVAVEDDEDLVLRRLIVTAIPSIHGVAHCRTLPSLETTADDVAIERGDYEDVRFFTETRVSIAELRALRERCDAAGFLRMARAPFVASLEDGRVLGDYRLDREERVAFAEMWLPEPIERCPENLPPWEPPRLDVLEGTYPPEIHATDTFE